MIVNSSFDKDNPNLGQRGTGLTTQNTSFGGNDWEDPNALLNAISQTSPDKSISQSSSSGGGGGWSIPGVGTSTGSPSNSGSWSSSTSGQANKISAYGQALPSAYRQQRFNTVFPWLQGQVGNANNAISSFGQGGFNQNAPAWNPPEISYKPTINDQQLQQQVNSGYAKADQMGARDIRGLQQQNGGSGFGSNSPLLAALTAQRGAQASATGADQERQARTDAQAANSQALFQQQMGRNQQYQQGQQNQLGWGQLTEDSQKAALQSRTALLNSLYGSLSGLAS